MSVNREAIRSFLERAVRFFKPGNLELGQALPITLAALGLGVVVIGPFLNHASSNVISSQIYREKMEEAYSAGAGVEHAIWRLMQDGLSEEIGEEGGVYTYTLDETVNDIRPEIEVKSEVEPGEFEIESSAGQTKVKASVEIEENGVKVITWEVVSR